MCKVEATPATVKKVKEIVDFIYEATIGEGTTGGWCKYPSRVRIAVSSLIGRGIVKKEGHPKHPIYKWVASLAPTPTLYKNVANDIVTRERASTVRYRAKKKIQAEIPTKENPVLVPIGQPIIDRFDGYTSQELWDELKRRGYAIEDNRLVMTTKTFLD